VQNPNQSSANHIYRRAKVAVGSEAGGFAAIKPPSVSRRRKLAINRRVCWRHFMVVKYDYFPHEDDMLIT